MSDSAGLINEHSDYRVAVRTADFSMNQFQTVVDRNLFGDIAHPLCNRLESMTRWRKLSICAIAPKEKVGENPPDNASDDPSKLWIIRERSGGSKRRSTAQIGN